jgi:hypothetical protein
MSPFIRVDCRCGRTLRANVDQAGTEIRCWECQATVVVPYPPSGGRLVREFLDGARELLRIEVLLRFLAGGLVIACALAIPRVGPAAGFALLAAIASLYPGFVRSSGPDGGTARPGPAWRAWMSRGAWGLGLALGLTAPVLLRHVVMDGYGRLLAWRGLGVAAVRAVLAAIRRHPLATAAALLLIPIGLLALEVASAAAFIQQGWFGFLVLDLFPNPASDHVAIRLENDTEQDPNLTPLSFFWRVYVHGLGLGYTLLGALPASLPRGPALRVRPWFLLQSAWHYPAVRVLDSALILACVGLLLAIQARWLGLIASIDVRPTVGSAERLGV